MSGRRIFAITTRILEQFRHDRRTLALLFVAPLVILSLLGYLLRGGGGAPRMGVVDEDSGPLGNVVASALQRSKLVRTAARRTASSTMTNRQGWLSPTEGARQASWISRSKVPAAA